MTPDQLTLYREKLRLALIPEGDKTLEHAFRRGWNEGIEFARNHLDAIFGKEPEKAS